MQNVILWTGPVNSGQLSNMNWITPTVSITVGGHSPSEFLVLGESLKNNQESKLDRLIRINKYDPTTFNTKCLSGFSAGYKLLESILEDDKSLKQLNVLLCLDTYYFNDGETPKGFYSFVQKSINGDSLMIMTGTGPNEAFLTPSVAIRKILKDFDIKQVDLSGIDYPTDLPKPTMVYKKGNFLFFDYVNTINHTQHVNVIGPGLLKTIVSSYIVLINNKFTAKQWVIPGTLLALGVGLAGVGWTLDRHKGHS